MKRILTGLALAAAATLVTATPAHAAPVNPAKALQKQFVKGHGVRISEKSRMSVDGKSLGTSTTTGRLEFGKSGIVASDIRTSSPKGSLSSLFAAPPRIISIDGHSYVQGGLYSEDLPDGKKWVRYNGQPSGSTYNQLIDIFEPKVLKLVLSHAKSSKSGLYKGSVTYKDLAKAYGSRLDGSFAKIKIDYALKTNSKGLITSLTSSWGLDFGILGNSRSTTETRYVGWGSKVSIKAPSKSVWIDVKDLGEDSDVPQEIPGNALKEIPESSLNSLAN